MSIPLLIEVHSEARRLVVAGSVAAPGDFRLKKLIPSLDQLAPKAPVFSKVSEAVKKVVEATEADSAGALLDLAALVSAILYTQAVSGVAGELSPIDTTFAVANGNVPQLSARTIWPIIEALTTTGSGRSEVIRSAHANGLFSDFRLMEAVNVGLDDHYREIAEFVASDLLPSYGASIVPLLRSSYQPKGGSGHARRLKYLHQMDPDGTRPLVKDALENGSPEVKIAAIECLGGYPEDLSYLLESARKGARAARVAAFSRLVFIDDPLAIAELKKAVTGKNLELTAAAIGSRPDSPLMTDVLAEARMVLGKVFSETATTEINANLSRLQLLLDCLVHSTDPECDAPFIELFEQREKLVQLKTPSSSGNHVLYSLVQHLCCKSYVTRAALIRSHATLHADHLEKAFFIATYDLPPKEAFDEFSSYLRTADNRTSVVTKVLLRYCSVDNFNPEKKFEIDPRWVDLALELGMFKIASMWADPSDVRVQRMLSSVFEKDFAKAEILNDCYDALSSMVRFQHPQAGDAFVQVITKLGHQGGRTPYLPEYFCRLIPFLPKSVLPEIEKFVEGVPGIDGEIVLYYLQQLKA